MEFFLLTVLIFICGAAIGSFLNVIIDRSGTDESIISGRSRCDHCKKPLQAIDLIPVASYLFLKGKCRYCKKKLSLYYPLVEIMTGILFVVTIASIFPAFSLGIISSLRIYMVITVLFMISSLVVIFFTDLKFGVIPFMAVLLAFMASFVIHLLFPINNYSLHNYFLSGFFLFLFFLSIFLVTRGKGMGFGDVIYAFLMGFLLGYPKVILGFYIAVLSGAIIPIIILVIKKRKIRGTIIPFGPFLVAGTIISFFWGNILSEQILSYLLR